MFRSLPRAAYALSAVLALAILTVLLRSAPAETEEQVAYQPAEPKTQPKKGPGAPGEFDPNVSLPEDRGYKVQIEAAEDYIRLENWEEATGILQKLVDIQEDKFTPVLRKTPQGQEAYVWRSVKQEANRLIGALPPNGRKFYQDTYGPPAAARLKEAKENNNNREQLTVVMRSWLHTDAGAEATLLLGTQLLDRGEFVGAAQCFERLLDRTATKDVASLTLFKAVIAFHQAGDKNNEDRTWRELKDRGAVKINGEAKDVKELEQYVNSLGRSGLAQSVSDWQYVGGSPSRAGRGDGDIAFMEAHWNVKTTRTGETDTWLNQATERLQANGLPILPASTPVTASVLKDGRKKNLAIFRSHWGVHALYTRTYIEPYHPWYRNQRIYYPGDMAWETYSNWSVDRMVKEPTKVNHVTEWIGAYLGGIGRPAMLFENSSVGHLSTNGVFVYAVEDLAVPPPPRQQQPNQPNPGGNQPNTLGDALKHNKLQAIDMFSGKLKWECPDTFRKIGMELIENGASCFFLGPPLPLGGTLWVVVEKNQAILLVNLDPETGHVLSTQVLANNTRHKLQNDAGRRVQAAHLAYGESMLVCPTNCGAILGYDMLDKSLVWAFPYRDRTLNENKAGWIQIDGQLYNPNGNNNWKVTAPIIADGKVVFAAPDATDLICLNLRDGSPLWRVKRGDSDYYLGGVYNGKVLVVGKDRVRALSLDKGEQVWSCDTGMPSGMGIASENFYYLPLSHEVGKSEPEIVAIDIDKGVIERRAESRKKEVPGNLVFYDGEVISQNLRTISAYPQMRVKLREMDERLSKNPNDPVGLTERGELRLDKGNLQGAVEDLALALKHNPPPETAAKARAKLHETLTDFLRKDFDAAEKFIPEYEELCKAELNTTGTNEEKAKEARRRRVNFLCLVGKGKEKQRKLIEAFDRYTEVATVAGPEELISTVDQPSVKALPEVWSRGRIAAMLRDATEEERKPIEEHVKKKWAEISRKGDVAELRTFVAVFGALFPAGREARLRLAEKLMEGNEPRDLLEAEGNLTLLRQDPADRLLAARAVEALARLNEKRGLPDDAAYYYDLLDREFKDVKMPDGRTGGQIYNDLATDRRTLLRLDRKPGFGGLSNGVQETQQSQPKQVYHFGIAGERLPFFQRNQIALNFSGHQLQLLDARGEARWSKPITQSPFQQIALLNMQPQQQHQIPPNLAKHACLVQGHLVVLPLGTMIYGVDPITGAVLWERNLLTSLAGNPTNSTINSVTANPRDGSVEVVFSDGLKMQLGSYSGGLESNVVCVRSADGLLALDPLSGRPLWVRSDVGKHADLFGDAEHLYVVDYDNNTNKEVSTRVLRAADGVTVPAGDFTTLYTKRLRVLGGRLLVADNTPEGSVRLHLYDIVAGKDVWSATYAPGSVLLHPETPHYAGVIEPTGMVEPSGKAHVVDLRTLKEVLNAPVVFQDFEGCTAVHLLADQTNLYAMPNKPVNSLPGENKVNQNVPMQSNLFPGIGLRALQVNGNIHAWDMTTGKVWKSLIPHEMVVLERFEDLPALLFTVRYQRYTNGAPGGPTFLWTEVLTLDKRSGLCKFQYANQKSFQPGTPAPPPNPPNGFAQFHAVTYDAHTGRLEFINYNFRVVHTTGVEGSGK
jgi:outer membrane protein assembly factor BamB